MELKYIIPNMEKTFGVLEFAGEGNTEQRRIDGRMQVLSRSYNLYSNIQRADDIIVVLPPEAGEKHFEVEDKVKLINPKIKAEGYKIGTRGFTNYKDYVFAELINPVYLQVDNQVTVSVAMKYLDQQTKATQISQFNLTLENSDNWTITN